MSRFERQYTPREKVMHKILGAAYQMTFAADGEDSPEYDQAAATAAMAVEFWGNSEAENYWELDHSLDPTTLFDVPEDDTEWSTDEPEPVSKGLNGDAPEPNGDSDEPVSIDLPAPGTKARDVVRAVAAANRDGVDWASPADLQDYGLTATNSVAPTRRYVDVLQYKQTDDRHNLYRIDPHRLDAVWTALRADGNGAEVPA